jgi:hypothetical protein
VPTTLVESGDIPDEAWIGLETGAKFTAKHPRSTRETTFTGPARVRPCVGHGEEAWLAHGTFVSEPAAGERPGAEEWLVTPAGVVRFGAARAVITVTEGTLTAGAKVDVKVTSGTVFAWTGDEAGPVRPSVVPLPAAPAASGSAGAAGATNAGDGWIRLEGPRTVTLSVKKVGKPEDLAAAAVDRCKAEATAAKDLAVSVASPDAALAQVAPRHVVARHLARAACGVAAVRVGLLPPSPAREGFAAALKEAEVDWKSFRPRGPHGRPH